MRLFLFILFVTIPPLKAESWHFEIPHSELHQSSEEDDVFHGPPISVVTGTIKDDENDSDEPEPGRSWSHHVDFNEMFPGEDQIAEETFSRRTYQLNPRFQQEGLRNDERRVQGDPVHDDEVELIEDDLVVPSFSQLFPKLPRIGGSSSSSGEEREQHDLFSSLFRGMGSKEPWWKGSNVCIKREEIDETNGTSSVSTPDGTVSFSSPSNSQFHMKLTTCEEMDTKYVCKVQVMGPQVERTVKTEYECCAGYNLDKKKAACERGRYENVAATIEELGGKEFLRLAKDAGLMDRMEDPNVTLTVFVPTDDAVNSYLSSGSHLLTHSNAIDFISSIPEAARRRRSILRRPAHESGGRDVRRHPQDNYPSSDWYQKHRRGPYQNHHIYEFNELGYEDEEESDASESESWKDNVMKQQEHFHRAKKTVTYGHIDAHSLHNHIIYGKISTDDFVDEKVVYGESQRPLRLNTWQVGADTVKTINCARIISGNHKGTNGIVHMVDKFLPPVRKDLLETIRTTPHLSVFNSLLNTAEMTPLLKDPTQHLTLLAPTNEALDKLGPSFLLKLQRGDTACLKRIIRHHILPMTFCSSIIYGKGKVHTLDHDELSLERSPDDKLIVNGSEIIVRDLMTTNGVIHVIDAVILSENDKPMTEILERDGHSAFLQKMREVGIDLNTLSNVTLFVPSASALAKIPTETLSNNEKLRDILLYHIATPEVRSCHFSHQEMLSTLSRNESVRINLYSTFPFFGGDGVVTAQCARLTRTDTLSCGGVIHEVDRVLMPPKMDLVHMLKTMGETSIFSRLLAENDALFRQLKNGEFHTMFVPTDSAFYSLPQDKLNSILNNKDEALKVLKRHVTSDPLCCAGVQPSLYFMTKRIATLGDINVPMFREPNGGVVYGSGKVVSCDISASNGIIHLVDKVLVDTDNLLKGRREQVGPCLPETLDNFNVHAFFMRL